METPPGTSHPSPHVDFGGLVGPQENLSALNTSVCTSLPLEPWSEQKSCGKWLQPVNGCQGITHGSVPRQNQASSLLICKRACVLHEKAFLINRPAPLELDKKWSQKDFINPRSVPGVCCDEQTLPGADNSSVPGIPAAIPADPGTLSTPGTALGCHSHLRGPGCSGASSLRACSL